MGCWFISCRTDWLHNKCHDRHGHHFCRSDLWFPQNETAKCLPIQFIVGQTGVPPNATADMHTFLSIRSVAPTKWDGWCVIDLVFVGQIGFRQMSRHTCTHSCRSGLWLPQTETADVLIDLFIVGQIGSTNATATMHTFLSIRFVAATKWDDWCVIIFDCRTDWCSTKCHGRCCYRVLSNRFVSSRNVPAALYRVLFREDRTIVIVAFRPVGGVGGGSHGFGSLTISGVIFTGTKNKHCSAFS